MLKKLQKNPLQTAFLIVILYGLWFIVPSLYNGIDPNASAKVGIEGALEMGISELITSSVLVVFISLLGWWKIIGFRRIEAGGLKFLIPIFSIILIILALSFSFDKSDAWFLGFTSPLQFLAVLGVMLLLGFVEEGIFRGVLFYGLSQKLSPLMTVFLSAFIFGLFHFVNILTGEPVVATFYQVIHAFAMGFLYAALRLRVKAIWPLMILHGLWDFSLFISQSTVQLGVATPDDIPVTAGLSIAVPALLYGLFVYWRWSKTQFHVISKNDTIRK